MAGTWLGRRCSSRHWRCHLVTRRRCLLPLVMALGGGRLALDTEAATVADAPADPGRQHRERRLGGR